MLFYENEKSLPKYLIHEKFKISAFFISEKTAPKMDKWTKLDILSFCNLLYLEIDF